jgi:hypothetical protein
VTRTSIVVWTVALLFAAVIGIWVVHEHRLRNDACAERPKSAECTQAKKTEDGAILMGVLGAVILVMFGGVAVAMARR